MNQMPEPELFKSAPPKGDPNIDPTTKAARAIIDEEVAARIAKTERLRAARLARKAIEQPVTSTKKARRGG